MSLIKSNMQIETLIDKLTGVFEGVVGSKKNIVNDRDLIDDKGFDYMHGYNQAITDIRSRIPEAVDGILELLKGDGYFPKQIEFNKRTWACVTAETEKVSILRGNEIFTVDISSLAGGGADGEGV